MGDRVDIDVAGAQAVGMQAVWINRAAAAPARGGAHPEYEIRDLAELSGVLGV